MNTQRAAALFAWLAGLALLGWLLAGQDWGELGPVLLATGPGLAWITLYHAVPLALDTLAWRALLPAEKRPGFGALALMRWYGESVNSLLPVAQVGGDVLRARLAALAGVPGGSAAASVLVDLTLSVLSLLVFVLAGTVLLTFSSRGNATNLIAISLALGAVGLTGFWLLQRSSLLARLLQSISRKGGGWARSLASGTDAFTRALDEIYRKPGALFTSSILQLAAWCAGAGEVWLALWFLDQPVSIGAALLIESLVQLIRNAAFAVPGALGVQEGGLMLTGPLAGVVPEAALAVSLAKRGRELLLGVPGLVFWYLGSARRQLA